jgi:ubiquinone biosynthesis protein Coq4
MEEESRPGARLRLLVQLLGSGAGAASLDLAALLGARGFEALFRRFVSHPDGQALLAERPDLADALADEEELLALPAGSLGRACAGAVAVGPRGARGDARLTTAHAWFQARLRVLPGLWRILAGIEAGRRGDAELLAFCGGALRQPALAGLLILAALGPRRRWWQSQRARAAAWRRGRGAVPVLVIPYERLLPCSLQTVRRSLRVEARGAGTSGVALAPQEIGGAP